MEPMTPSNPRGCVVLLEEDAQIRALLERWLSEAGYPFAAGAAATASLVIVNVADPRLATPMIEAVREEYDAPILVLSARFRRGLAGSADVARRLGVKKVLPKPFTRKELLAAVRESLEGGV
jgi:DNA-binding response OmpR family regulator